MYRERLTITLDSELLAAVDTTIDHSQIRNRSHAIEHAIREGLAVHELTQVVITGETTQLPALIQVLAPFSIQEYNALSSENTLAKSLEELTGLPVSRLPADFGSAAALLLIQDKLSAPFLYINTAALRIPATILPAYTFHRHNNGIVTHLLQVENTTFIPTGISIIEPEMLRTIPPGSASLESTIFPNLEKAGRVMTYVCR